MSGPILELIHLQGIGADLFGIHNLKVNIIYLIRHNVWIFGVLVFL